MWSDKWYGQATFEPFETSSRPFDPFDPYIQEINRAKIERSDDINWWMEWLGATDFDSLVFRESFRMCMHWNTAWQHHLDQNDVQVLFDNGRLFNFGSFQTCPPAGEINRMSLTGFGHDSINQWYCLRARIKRMGEQLECGRCDSGVIWPSQAAKARYENWEPEEPPTGLGWQIWETVSEGSPVSPVFATSDELENWLIEQGHSEGAAEQFVKSGWVPSAVSVVSKEGVRFYKDIESANAEN